MDDLGFALGITSIGAAMAAAWLSLSPYVGLTWGILIGSVAALCASVLLGWWSS